MVVMSICSTQINKLGIGSFCQRIICSLGDELLRLEGEFIVKALDGLSAQAFLIEKYCFPVEFTWPG